MQWAVKILPSFPVLYIVIPTPILYVSKNKFVLCCLISIYPNRNSDTILLLFLLSRRESHKLALLFFLVGRDSRGSPLDQGGQCLQGYPVHPEKVQDVILLRGNICSREKNVQMTDLSSVTTIDTRWSPSTWTTRNSCNAIRARESWHAHLTPLSFRASGPITTRFSFLSFVTWLSFWPWVALCTRRTWKSRCTGCTTSSFLSYTFASNTGRRAVSLLGTGHTPVLPGIRIVPGLCLVIVVAIARGTRVEPAILRIKLRWK